MIFVTRDGVPRRSPPASETVFAKAGTDGVCYVLCSVDGRLFNPFTMNNVNRQDRERGEAMFKLRKCSQKCYQYYITFLRTKNHTHFVIAEREAVNG